MTITLPHMIATEEERNGPPWAQNLEWQIENMRNNFNWESEQQVLENQLQQRLRAGRSLEELWILQGMFLWFVVRG
jgi:hypothetical protein